MCVFVLKAVEQVTKEMSPKMPRMSWVRLERIVSEDYSEEMEF